MTEKKEKPKINWHKVFEVTDEEREFIEKYPHLGLSKWATGFARRFKGIASASSFPSEGRLIHLDAWKGASKYLKSHRGSTFPFKIKVENRRLNIVFKERFTLHAVCTKCTFYHSDRVVCGQLSHQEARDEMNGDLMQIDIRPSFDNKLYATFEKTINWIRSERLEKELLAEEKGELRQFNATLRVTTDYDIKVMAPGPITARKMLEKLASEERPDQPVSAKEEIIGVFDAHSRILKVMTEGSATNKKRRY